MPEYELYQELPPEYRESLMGLLFFEADHRFALSRRYLEGIPLIPRPEEAGMLANLAFNEISRATGGYDMLCSLGLKIEPHIQGVAQSTDPADNLTKDRAQDWAEMAAFCFLYVEVMRFRLSYYERCSYQPLREWSSNCLATMDQRNMGAWAVQRIIALDSADALDHLEAGFRRFFTTAVDLVTAPKNPAMCQALSSAGLWTADWQQVRPQFAARIQHLFVDYTIPLDVTDLYQTSA